MPVSQRNSWIEQSIGLRIIGDNEVAQARRRCRLTGSNPALARQMAWRLGCDAPEVEFPGDLPARSPHSGVSMSLSAYRPLLSALALSLFFTATGALAQDGDSTRTFLQRVQGYYSAADGWETYSTCRSAMDQPLTYTEADFKRLSIPDIDKLAREAKAAYDSYQRYSRALDTLSLTQMSAKEFWNLGHNGQSDLVASAEDTVSKWPLYSGSMVRMKLPSKTAQEFLNLSAAERKQLFDDSQGSGRAWHQLLRGYYSAEDGWKTYQKCRQEMDQPVEYTEHDFIHLSIAEIDTLARQAKRISDLYHRYEVAITQLGLEALPKSAFCKLGDGQAALVDGTEDAAAKWPEYSANMKRLGQTVKTQREFVELSATDRASLYDQSRGSARSTRQFVLGSYSAADGWKAYNESLTALGLPLKYTEFQFINFDVPAIDKLARHALKSKELYTKLTDLCTQAKKPCTYNPAEIYVSDDLSRWEQECQDRQQEWASRILYAASCERVGRQPDWSVFEGKHAKEQLEAATLAESVSANFSKYRLLCNKLGRSIDTGFLELPITAQREKITALRDELSEQRKELWEQRKETAAKYGKEAAEYAKEVAPDIVAFLLQQAFGGPSASGQSPRQQANHGRVRSQVHRAESPKGHAESSNP